MVVVVSNRGGGNAGSICINGGLGPGYEIWGRWVLLAVSGEFLSYPSMMYRGMPPSIFSHSSSAPQKALPGSEFSDCSREVYVNTQTSQKDMVTCKLLK
ncbi:hypothetical protein Tco_0765024 [Tanacetum coccineum]